VVVLIRLAAVIAVVGLSWNAVHVIIGAAVEGAAHTAVAVVYRIIGIMLALVLVASAPQIVNSLQGLLRTPLVH
jgi:hypothetical protein